MAHNVADLNTQLEVLNIFSEWSGIRRNISECRLTCYIYELQALKHKKNRDSALQTRLANIRVGHTPIPTTSQDDPLPEGELGTALTASVCPKAYLKWTIDTLTTISKAFLATLLAPDINQRLHLLGANLKIKVEGTRED